jgi:hypothetical protein
MPFVDYFQELEQLAEERGEKRGLLMSIEAILRLRLPEQVETLLGRVKQYHDPELLRRVLAAAAAADVAQLNQLLP